MFISEVSETFMLAQDKGWGYSNGVGNEESCGEALSLFLTVQFQLSQGLGTTWLMNGTPSTWLNTSLPASNPASTEFDSTGQWGGPSTGTHYGSRQDYVGSVKPWAGNGPATGCCMAFLYYLFHQLQFTSIPQIIAAAPGVDSSNNVIGGSCLKGVYKNLTGDDSDPFPYFASLLAAAYPPDQVASIPGPNVDDPWPLGSLSYVGAKDTWGKDEITDVIDKGGTYPDGFLVALDGFSLNVLGGTRAVGADHRVPGGDDGPVRDDAEHLPSERQPQRSPADPVRLRRAVRQSARHLSRDGRDAGGGQHGDHRARQGTSGDDRVLLHGQRDALFHQRRTSIPPIRTTSTCPGSARTSGCSQRRRAHRSPRRPPCRGVPSSSRTRRAAASTQRAPTHISRRC